MSHKIELRNTVEGWKSVILNGRFVGKLRVFENVEPPVLTMAYIGALGGMPEFSKIGYFAGISQAQHAIVAHHFRMIERGRFKPFRRARP